MKDIILKFKQKRNEYYLSRLFDILEDMENWELDSLKLCCELELDERKRIETGGYECLNVQNNSLYN